MNIRIQIVVAVVTVVALVIILSMIRKKTLELRYALAWLFIGAGIIVLDVFPKLIEWASEILGIADPVNALFFFGFCFSLVIIFMLTIAVSRTSIRIKALAQELALYKAEGISVEDKEDCVRKEERCLD